jgi:hypothetical protein
VAAGAVEISWMDLSRMTWNRKPGRLESDRR